MILQEVTSKPIDRIAIGQERKFSIKPSAKAFRILSSTIYPDPIAAPIRELATNAADSHRDAGVKEPFLVHLPNQLEPYFSIRDYGTGISDENIDSVYCTYFESTRTGSNNYTGGFGLGSKTPFCYSDTFTVISYFNGRKMIFTAFLEDGEPKIAKFADEETDQRNGLEVSFPVKRDDIQNFVSTAKRIYSRFVDKPKVVGNSDFKLDDITYVIKGNGWGIRDTHKQGNRYMNEQSHIVMGNISYPIDTNKIYAKTESTRSLLNCGVEIQFAVGDLQPTVSREHLQYDQGSIDKINRKLEEICLELNATFEKDLAAAANLFEARLLYGKLFGDQSAYGWQLKQICRSSTLKYKGVALSDSIYIRAVISEYYKKTNNKNPIPYFVNWHREELSRSGKRTVKKIRQLDLTAVPGLEFYINDWTKGHEGRIRQYIFNNKKPVYLIEDGIYADKVLLKEIFDTIGLDESVIKKTSDLDKVIPKPRVVKPKSDIQDMLVFNGSATWKHSHSWTSKSIDTLKGDHYYVDVSGYTSETVGMDVLSKLFEAVKSITKIEPEVIGLRSANGKKLKKLPNWVDFLEYSKKIVQDYVDKNKLSQLIANSFEYSSYSACSNNQPEMAIKSSDLEKDSLAYEYLTHVEYLSTESKKLSNLGWVSGIEILKNIGITLTTSVAEHNITKERLEIANRYKLLSYIIPERETWRMANSTGWRPALISYLNSIKKV